MMKKLLLLGFIFGFYTPVSAEQYPIHKYTCPDSGGECNEEERAVVKLVNDKYWKMLSDRIKENKHYKILGILFIKIVENVNIQSVQRRICQLML